MNSLKSSVQYVSAVIIGKLILTLTQKANIGGGTAAPGLYASKIDPSILSKCISQIESDAVVITGTNGKTTTSRIISHYFSQNNYTYIHNKSGSNLERGLISACIQKVTWYGKINKGTHAVWELDEAEFSKSLEVVKPKWIIMLNLCRDQLDRYGEVDVTREKWKNALIHYNNECSLLYNADDPQLCALVNQLQSQSNIKCIGFSLLGESVNTKSNILDPLNLVLCPNCNNLLTFTTRTITGQGSFVCKTCGFSNNKIKNQISQISEAKGRTSVRFRHGVSELTVTTKLHGIYNMYNLAAALSFLAEYTSDFDKSIMQIENVDAAFGRMEVVPYKNREIIVVLIKNPTGAKEALKTIFTTQRKIKSAAFLLNDNFADGKDVSWIWDIPWQEYLKENDIVAIAAGTRVYDMCVRLQYAGITKENIRAVENLNEILTVIESNSEEGDVVPLFSTYTAMLEMQSVFEKKGVKKIYWKES